VKPIRIAVLAVSALLGVQAGRAVAQPPRQYAWLHGWDSQGRPFDLRTLRGQVIALTFASKQTRDEAIDVNDELTRLVAPGRVALVSVVDLRDVPTYAYGTARKHIRDADQPGVVHVVDERGDLGRSFQVDPRRTVDIFVLGRDGEILGHFVGSAGVDEAMRLIQRALAGGA
jgi:hypothetical protein